MSFSAAIPLSLSGEFSALGNKALEGVQLWKLYASSLSGCPVELTVEDDESSERKAGEITEKFCADKTVDAVFGPYSSRLTLAAAKAARKSGKTLWNHGGASNETDKYPNIISAITPAGGYFAPAVEMISGGKSGRAVIVSAKGSGFSKAVTDGAEKLAAEAGIKVARVEYDRSEGAERVAGELKKTDSLLCAGRMEDDIALAEKILSMSGKPDFLCFVAAGIDEFGAIFGKRAEGVHSVSQWEESAAPQEPDFGPSPAVFAGLFRKRYGHPPDYPAAQAFNIGLVAQKCAASAGTTDDELMRKAALELDFTTFYGRFKTDRRGKQIGHKTVVTLWRGGRRVVLNDGG